MKLCLVALTLLVTACASAPSPIDLAAESQALVVCPQAETVPGIDVSHWQGEIDWDAVATTEAAFAIVRVSHGTSIRDRYFERNWPEVRRVGLIRGVYQFFSAADDPIEQADLLIEAIGGVYTPGDLPPVLDVEGMSLDGPDAPVVVERMHAWLARVESRLGVRPIIYTAKYFWQDGLGNPDFSEYPLWVANYGVSCPDLPAHWTSFRIWQWGGAPVAGIAGNVDQNYFDGTLEELRAFAGATVTCGDGVCSPGESCAADCPTCRSIPPAGRIVDESELCFERGGSPAYWHDEAAGHDGTLVWTHTTDSTAVDNHGVWSLALDEAGRYSIEAYTAAPWAQSTRARYQVRHSGALDDFVVDQSATDGWTFLGEVELAAGGDQWVRLEDNTGEPYSTRTQIAFDAIRLTRLDAPAPDAGTPRDDAGSAIESDGGLATADAAMPPAASPGGCSCRASGGSSQSYLLLAIALPLLFRRRR